MNLRSKNTLLNLLLMVGLVSLFAVGCGDSRKDYVYTGTHTTATEGDLLFHFDTGLLAQGTLHAILPAGTTDIEFRFYDEMDEFGNLGNQVDLRFAAPADTVLIEDVPVSAGHVVVTAFDASGIPLGVIGVNIEVVPAYVADVYLPDFNTSVTFDALNVSPSNIILVDGDASVFLVPEATFTLADNSDYARVYYVYLDNSDVNYTLGLPPTGLLAPVNFDDNTGEVSFANGGSNTEIIATYTSNGVTHTDVVSVGTYDFEVFASTGSAGSPIAFPTANTDGEFIHQPSYNALFTDTDGTAANISSGFSFALVDDVDGVIGVDEATGAIEFDENVYDGDDVVVAVSYTPLLGGKTVTDEVTFFFDAPSAASLSASAGVLQKGQKSNATDDSSWDDSDASVMFPDARMEFAALADPSDPTTAVGRDVRYALEFDDGNGTLLQLTASDVTFSVDDSDLDDGITISNDGTIIFNGDYVDYNGGDDFSFTVTVTYDNSGELFTADIVFNIVENV